MKRSNLFIFILLYSFANFSFSNTFFTAYADENNLPNPNPISSQSQGATNLDIPKTNLTALETSDGGILCYTLDFTDKAVEQYKITGTHWRISMSNQGKETLLDEYDWGLGLNPDKSSKRIDTFSGIKVTNKVNDAYVIYGYGIRNQLRNAVYKCSVAIQTAYGIGPFENKFVTATFNTVDFKPIKTATKTIVCVRGKSTKKVTGQNPTCPKGYKTK